jgi:hypothetical protein
MCKDAKHNCLNCERDAGVKRLLERSTRILGILGAIMSAKPSEARGDDLWTIYVAPQ